MDPWIVLAWVVVACISAVVIMLTASVLVSMTRQMRSMWGKPRLAPEAVADRLTAADRKRIRESDHTVPILRDMEEGH